MKNKKKENTILELQKIIDNINIKHVKLPKGVISLHDFYEQNGSEATMDFIRDLQDKADQDAFSKEREEFNGRNYKSEIATTFEEEEGYKLRKINTQRLRMETPFYNYDVLGHLDQDHSSLRVTLLIEEISTGNRERSKIDLYERMAVHSLILQLHELFGIPTEELEEHVKQLTNLLETHRERSQIDLEDNKNAPVVPRISTGESRKAIKLLKSPKLLEEINSTLEQAGIVGEEASRMLLYIAASSFTSSHPLHVLVQGTSGSGKSHLLNTIGYCMPEEDVISMTRVTSKSFYHYKEDELVGKLMLIQDFDGLDEEAQYAFRELQTAKEISSSTTYKNSQGELMSKIKKVKSQFASILATTKADVYYDNMSRCIVIGVDESREQTERIIDHQNHYLAGLVDLNKQLDSQRLLKNIIRCLKNHEVVNPYAHLIKLPMAAKMQRRLNEQFQTFIRQITLLHQYQRDVDEQGRLVTTIEDIEIAINILFEAIMLKVDELDSSLRQFFNRMKSFIGDKDKEFLQREVRQALNVSKTSCFRYMEDLLELEYVSRTGGYGNRGYRYRIIHWDDMVKIKTEIKEALLTQVKALKNGRSANGTPRNTNGTPVEHQKPHKQGENGVAVQNSTGAHIRDAVPFSKKGSTATTKKVSETLKKGVRDTRDTKKDGQDTSEDKRA